MTQPLYGEFSAAYMLVRNLKSALNKNPDAQVSDELAALKKILAGELHYEQSMSRLLYRDAAYCLALIYSKSRRPEYAEENLLFIRGLFGKNRQKVRLAAALALGDLSVPLPGVRVDFPKIREQETDWGEIPAMFELDPGQYQREGRSFLFDLDQDRLLVVKTSDEKNAPGLRLEAGWMGKMSRMDFPVSFHIPTPLSLKGVVLGRLKNAPQNENLPSPCHYLAYVADKKYFAYPNDHRPGKSVPFAVFREAMSRSAFLLGHLAGQGIMHTALIPLFHNRVQAARRNDLGSYEWHRMGRLDQWLSSCAYPNFGLSGLRDFEHFEIFTKTGTRFYLETGSQILSLCLVAASYFRNLQPGLQGLDREGNPVDARHLFDRGKLKTLLEECAAGYFKGLAGQNFSGHPMDMDLLVSRMVEEMGVDKHMEEVVRAVDQERMPPESFARLLTERGFGPEETSRIRQGEKDIAIMTGPHLGGFNSGISLPELIDFVSIFAAMCAASMAGPGPDLAKT